MKLHQAITVLQTLQNLLYAHREVIVSVKGLVKLLRAQQGLSIPMREEQV